MTALGVPPLTSPGSLEGHLFTGGSDGSVKLWRIDGEQSEEVQSLDLRGKLPLDLAVAYLPGSDGECRNTSTSA